MLRNRVLACGLVLAGLAIGASSSADAAAVLNVRSFFSIGIRANSLLPEGVTASCFGDGCYGSLLEQFSITSGTLTIKDHSSGGLILTNNSNVDYGGMAVLYASYSAFNPGGPAIGASVSNPTTESAGFSSAVTFGSKVLDFHSCQTSVATPACGVGSPDDNTILIFLAIPTPGNTSSTDQFSLNISAQLTTVPEPAGTFLGGAMLVAGVRSRRLHRKC
jgi:hypothetical protein